MDLKSFIRDVPDFPKQGIVFKDITTLLKDAAAFKEAVSRLTAPFRSRGIDLVLGIEARGFIFAPLVALELSAGFVPMRKPGKLPAETVRETYALEYGEDAIEVHKDAIRPGDKALIVDDLLATGGTARAAAKLVRKLGGTVEAAAFLIELDFLKGRKNLEGLEVLSIITY